MRQPDEHVIGRGEGGADAADGALQCQTARQLGIGRFSDRVRRPLVAAVSHAGNLPTTDTLCKSIRKSVSE